MASRIINRFEQLWLRHKHRNTLVITPKARRSVSTDDVFWLFHHRFCGHMATYEDRNDVEFFFVPNPETGVTTAMLPDEFNEGQ